MDNSVPFVVSCIGGANLCVSVSLQTSLFHPGFHFRQNKLGKPVGYPFLFVTPVPVGDPRQGVLQPDLLDIYFFLLPWSFDPREFFPLGVETFFNLAFVQTSPPSPHFKWGAWEEEVWGLQGWGRRFELQFKYQSPGGLPVMLSDLQ